MNSAFPSQHILGREHREVGNYWGTNTFVVLVSAMGFVDNSRIMEYHQLHLWTLAKLRICIMKPWYTTDMDDLTWWSHLSHSVEVINFSFLSRLLNSPEVMSVLCVTNVWAAITFYISSQRVSDMTWNMIFTLDVRCPDLMCHFEGCGVWCCWILLHQEVFLISTSS